MRSESFRAFKGFQPVFGSPEECVACVLCVSDLARASPRHWQVFARLGAPQELLALLRKSPRVQFLAQHVPKVRAECSRGA